jgi:hypothetical protein
MFRKADGHFAVNLCAAKNRAIAEAMLPILQP